MIIFNGVAWAKAHSFSPQKAVEVNSLNCDRRPRTEPSKRRVSRGWLARGSAPAGQFFEPSYGAKDSFICKGEAGFLVYKTDRHLRCEGLAELDRLHAPKMTHCVAMVGRRSQGSKYRNAMSPERIFMRTRSK